MKVIKIRITMSDARVHGTTENFDYEPVKTTQKTLDEVIDHMIVLITHELALNAIEDDYDLEFVYKCKLKEYED